MPLMGSLVDDTGEKRISELEDISTEPLKTAKQKEQRLKTK